MTYQSILFFADRLPPLTGGVEMHAGAFIEYFTNHTQFPLSGVITRNARKQDCLVSQEGVSPIEIKNLSNTLNPAFVFFNSGRWIEELKEIREIFSEATFLYRTGGNEILKAPLVHKCIPNHFLRQCYWAEILNNTIDLLITNSNYTETRLRSVGITCPFVRCVGGVNTSALKLEQASTQKPPTIFCAARFVPYKNHSLMLSVIHELRLRGHDFRVRLAGDGPLLAQTKEQALRDDLTSVVEFMGALDNKETCQEISQATLYMQLSTDQATEVPGGSYIHSEGMGRSILEALTAGTFVIAGQSGALAEIVTPDRGLLVEIGNPKQIADKIEPILHHLPSRCPFLDDFSWTRIFNRYEELFEEYS
jgi:glycosyltransferase involved in cell wall biosynthesis